MRLQDYQVVSCAMPVVAEAKVLYRSTIGESLCRMHNSTALDLQSRTNGRAFAPPSQRRLDAVSRVGSTRKTRSDTIKSTVFHVFSDLLHIQPLRMREQRQNAIGDRGSRATAVSPCGL